ncbi:MAG: TRAP transporter small permease subunit [Rhizobiaceae bacterium]|nr:TRAP transporter small permease subunit [Rhizobiaceae bacterium]MCV0405320.1 TRAP transporter small permease subunit [Rhizobiaceae bacterium]
MLKTFARVTGRINDLVGYVTAHLVLVMFVLLFCEVLFRYLWRQPTVWTGELSQMLFGVYALLGGGYLLARGGHVNVDIVYGAFPPRVKASIDVFTSILFFLFVAVLLWQGLSLASDSIARWERSHSAWNPPIWPVKLAIPLAALLILLQGLVKLASDILVALGHEPVAAGDAEAPGDQL